MLFVIWVQNYTLYFIQLQAQTKQKPTKTEQIQKLFVSLPPNSAIMYSLKEFWQIRNLPEPEGEWDGNVICLETNAEWSFGANQTHGFLSCYIYTIITRGWLTILYNNSELTLREGDLYTYSPGFEITILSSSSDYSGICLLGDEHFTLSLPTVRDAIRTAYFTVVELTSPVLPLKTDDFRRLRELMQMMIHYQQMGLPLANGSLLVLFCHPSGVTIGSCRAL